MRAIEGYDLELFAINTGELYQTHLYMARNHAPASGWREYLRCQVIPLYCKQVEPVTYDFETVANVAQSLKDYYEQHIVESQCRFTFNNQRCRLPEGHAGGHIAEGH